MAAGAPRQGAPSRRSGGGGKEAAPDWASLQIDMTQLIAARVLATGGFPDYVRFRAVCSQWRAAAASPRGRGLVDPRLHPRRWMLFPEGFGEYPGHPAHGGHARFFDLSAAGAIVRVPIPELENHCVLDSPDGLLLLQRDGDTAVRLLHPFTGDLAELPSIRSLAKQLSPLENLPGNGSDLVRVLVRKVCAAVNVTATGVVSVMLALERFGRVAFASAGDDEWTISSWKVRGLYRTLGYQGKLYTVKRERELTHISLITLPLPPHEGEVSLPELPPPKTVATCSSEHIFLPSLVELDSAIMLVGYNNSSCSCILVLKLADLVVGRIVPVASIGDHVIFAGARSLCVSSSWLPSIGSNSVIFFHAGYGHLMQYHLVTGAWSTASDGYLMPSTQTRPCGLIHHIFTCCDRQFWNKGFLFYNASRVPEWQGTQAWRIGEQRIPILLWITCT
ncbi:unnamed protein product [Urochloa decumbens]|uniref:KIB1-4 beta-propeller domain-containing protein n=1 Tax=Urochloa decumbens TaxID=240449 RepID=A0ABC9GDF7_9POAL